MGESNELVVAAIEDIIDSPVSFQSVRELIVENQARGRIPTHRLPIGNRKLKIEAGTHPEGLPSQPCARMDPPIPMEAPPPARAISERLTGTLQLPMQKLKVASELPFFFQRKGHPKFHPSGCGLASIDKLEQLRAEVNEVSERVVKEGPGQMQLRFSQSVFQSERQTPGFAPVEAGDCRHWVPRGHRKRAT